MKICPSQEGEGAKNILTKCPNLNLQTEWTLLGQVELTAWTWAIVVYIGSQWSILGGENEEQ